MQFHIKKESANTQKMAGVEEQRKQQFSCLALALCTIHPFMPSPSLLLVKVIRSFYHLLCPSQYPSLK